MSNVNFHKPKQIIEFDFLKNNGSTVISRITEMKIETVRKDTQTFWKI